MEGMEQKKKTWYSKQYDSWVPWFEDKFLGWFGENKTSYVAKDKLKETTGQANVTGDENVDQATGDVSETVGNQFGDGGLAQPAGKLTSDQVMTRSERGGKGESGGYVK